MEASKSRGPMNDDTLLDNAIPRINLGMILRGDSTELRAFMDDVKALKAKYPHTYVVFAHGTSKRLWLYEEVNSQCHPVTIEKGMGKGHVCPDAASDEVCEELLPEPAD